MEKYGKNAKEIENNISDVEVRIMHLLYSSRNMYRFVFISIFMLFFNEFILLLSGRYTENDW